MAGWICLQRDIQDHWIYQDPEKFRAWVDMIMLANHEPKKIRINNAFVICERGQLAYSQLSLADRWKWSRQVTRTFLQLLKNESMIEIESNQHTSIITICNYSIYQGYQPQKQPTVNQPTVNQPTNHQTNQRLTNQLTNENPVFIGVAEDDQPTPNQESNHQVNHQTIQNLTTTKQITIQQENNKQNNTTPVPINGTGALPAERQVFIRIPLNVNNTFHNVYEVDIPGWEEIYPGVDVRQELRKMFGYFKENTVRRKTVRGIGKCINSWLARAQDSGGNKFNGNGYQQKTKAEIIREKNEIHGQSWLAKMELEDATNRS
jgi:hypothetical protein